MKLRLACLACVSLIAAAPAAAEPTIGDAVADVQRALDDPRNEKAVNDIMRSLTDAMLAMPAGDIEAAVEGRTATPAEKKLTVRDLARRDDPQFEAKLKQRIARSGPTLRQNLKALAAALPALTKSLEDAGKAVERAAANLPDPTYPKR